jgi:hypothetical protein
VKVYYDVSEKRINQLYAAIKLCATETLVANSYFNNMHGGILYLGDGWSALPYFRQGGTGPGLVEIYRHGASRRYYTREVRL